MGLNNGRLQGDCANYCNLSLTASEGSRSREYKVFKISGGSDVFFKSRFSFYKCDFACTFDIEAGKLRASACFSCHGLEGVSANLKYPNLAGQSAEYLMKQAMLSVREAAKTQSCRPWRVP